MPNEDYRTTRDIVIAGGSKAFVLPAGSRWDCSEAFVSVLIGMGDDTTAELKMHLQDAMDLGLVEPG